MLIPKNSIIFMGTWSIHHDETLFKNPSAFDPDRYLGHSKLASDYAGSPDWANRDESCPRGVDIVANGPVYITTATVPVVVSVQACI